MLIALAAGFDRIIVTPSSDAKLDALPAKFGAELASYNYRTCPDQAAEVRRLTDGRGVDFVVNNSGPGGIPADIEALVPRHGTVTLVGFLAGIMADWNPGLLLNLIHKTAKIQHVLFLFSFVFLPLFW